MILRLHDSRLRIPPANSFGSVSVGASITPTNNHQSSNPLVNILLDWISGFITIESESQVKKLVSYLSEVFSTEFVHQFDQGWSDGHHNFLHTYHSVCGVVIRYALPDEPGWPGCGKLYLLMPGTPLKGLNIDEMAWLMLTLMHDYFIQFNRIDATCDLHLETGLKLMKNAYRASLKDNYKNFRSSVYTKGTHKHILAFGRRACPRYLRIYDKNLQTKGEYPYVRVELELKKDHARLFASEIQDRMLNSPDYLPDLIRDTVFGSIDFIDRSKDSTGTHVARCPRLSWWSEFLGSVSASPVRNIPPRTPTTFKQKIDWAIRSWSTTLAQFNEVLGGDFVNSFLHSLIENGRDRLTAFHRAQNRVQIQQNLQEKEDFYKGTESRSFLLNHLNEAQRRLSAMQSVPAPV